MYTLVLIGFLGGLLTGISPCILPVLPAVLFSGTNRAPYRVIAGLVLSFSLVTLAGAAVLQSLHLPADIIRWVGLLALVVIGIGLIFPRVEQLLERPFALLPQRDIADGRRGFGLGLALGVLYAPCAGPVLAAVVVAGATGRVGLDTIALTLSFAVGTALPLLVFALAGRRISERVKAFQHRQRQVRIAGGVVMLVVAVALALNLPATVQRNIPDYTASLQTQIAPASNALSTCVEGASRLQDCGAAPDIVGIDSWFNTPSDAPVDLKALRGKVVLVDFWTYSCINCQRAIEHVTSWYDRYKDQGFTVIGVHTPEYPFEQIRANVVKGAADLHIKYPVALDNSYATWTNYHNQYWPASYLIDAHGVVRHLKFGEGDYDVTEGMIRDLLAQAKS
ncbi:cytochrome C biogenesis protein [Mycobacterium sp. 852013-50091_SCH5140682]|nr:cytochrome C biogenesis protein [Mycobacterium sp. 852013-50091_SCH5140682]